MVEKSENEQKPKMSRGLDWKDLTPGCEVAVKHSLLTDSVQGRVIEVRQLLGGKLATVALELLEPMLWDRL